MVDQHHATTLASLNAGAWTGGDMLH
jgi:hypothetical protein